MICRTYVRAAACSVHNNVQYTYTLVIDVRIINSVFSTFVFGDKQIINDTSYFQFNLLCSRKCMKQETLRDRFSIQLASAHAFLTIIFQQKYSPQTCFAEHYNIMIFTLRSRTFHFDLRNRAIGVYTGLPLYNLTPRNS